MYKFIEVHKVEYSSVDRSDRVTKIALNPRYIMEVYLCHQPCGEDSTKIITTDENITVQESYDEVMKMINGDTDETLKKALTNNGVRIR